MADSIDRRRFLGLGAAAAGGALGCRRAAAPAAGDDELPAMRFRPLGATGLEVSEIAFGAHGVDNPALMAAALDAGITTFCTSGRYMDGREELALGDTLARLKPPRDRLVILTGNGFSAGDTVRSISADIDGSLQRLRVDTIDLWCNAMVSSPEEVLFEPLFEAFERARRAGKVRHLALAGHHGGMQACLEAGIESGIYQAFFTKYDFVSYPEQDEILNRAATRGIGTMVFKVNAGHREHEVRDLESGGLSFHQATLKWALGRPEVASVAVTFTNFDRIRDSVRAVGGSLTAAETAMMRRYAGEIERRYCRFCASCEGRCPRGVAVAEIMRYEMYLTCYGRRREARRLYAELPTRAGAGACAGCPGPCDSACPFGREVRTGLIDAHAALAARGA